VLRFEDILDKVAAYMPGADTDIIKKAYVYSARVHQGQLRQSGEPYFVHPQEVAGILTNLRMDVNSIAAGLLHDTVEDTLTTLDEVKKIFGEEVATLVDGVTKIGQISFSSSEEKQAENFRKVFVAMAKDIRVILIKLADRLHNMRTLDSLDERRRAKIARETIDIYAPLAHRLGIYWMKSELEDLAFRHTKSETYYRLAKLVNKTRKARDKFTEEMGRLIEESLASEKLKARGVGRAKHLYSIFQKMEHQNLTFDQIFDIIGFRIIVGSVKECYEALGIIHSRWKPVPGRFKDYIAMPKANLYQSLHTTVIGPNGERVEIQIRTEDMHRVAEEGIAAHWKYKEGRVVQDKDEKAFSWLRRLVEFQHEVVDAGEFLDTVRIDMFPDDVYVFTPKGDVREFPKGATAMDFAYSIHTDVGHHCVGARVNGRLVPLRYELRSGDTVEIMTSSHRWPSKDWLKSVVTSRAKAKVRQWIKKEERERSLALGRELLEKEFAKYGLNFSRITKEETFPKVLSQLNYKSLESLIASVGYGKITPTPILRKFFPQDQHIPKEEPSALRKIIRAVTGKPSEGILIKGVEDVLVRLCKGCNPLPGDSVIGFITRGRGVTVHTTSCPKALEADPERRIEVQWSSTDGQVRLAKIKVVCVDRPGMLANITQSIAAFHVNIQKASAKGIKDQKAVNIFELAVKNLAHLKEVIRSVEKVGGVISVERV